jgi:hypothetical protein
LADAQHNIAIVQKKNRVFYIIKIGNHKRAYHFDILGFQKAYLKRLDNFIVIFHSIKGLIVTSLKYTIPRPHKGTSKPFKKQKTK